MVAEDCWHGTMDQTQCAADFHILLSPSPRRTSQELRNACTSLWLRQLFDFRGPPLWSDGGCWPSRLRLGHARDRDGIVVRKDSR